MPAHAFSASPSSRSVDIQIDEAQQRIHVTISGQADGPRVWNAICEMFLNRPMLTGYDMLYDLREYNGDVEAEHVKPIVALYNSVRVPEADGTRTAFLTQDPNFTFWAEAMTFQFPGRTHAAFEGESDADVFLSVPRARRQG